MQFETRHFRSDHAQVEIRQQGESLELCFDVMSVQSRINPNQPHLLQMPNLQAMMAALLFVPAPQTALLLGVGGGSLIHFLRHHYPQMHITALDYDARLIRILQQEYGLPKTDEKLHYEFADARDWLKQEHGRFDLVLCDLFDGPKSLPELMQPEYLATLKALTSAQGALVMNLVAKGPHLWRGFWSDLERRFNGKVLRLGFEQLENRLIYAFHALQAFEDMSDLIGQAMQQTEALMIPQIQYLTQIYDQNPVGGVLP